MCARRAHVGIESPRKDSRWSLHPLEQGMRTNGPLAGGLEVTILTRIRSCAYLPVMYFINGLSVQDTFVITGLFTQNCLPSSVRKFIGPTDNFLLLRFSNIHSQILKRTNTLKIGNHRTSIPQAMWSWASYLASFELFM